MCDGGSDKELQGERGAKGCQLSKGLGRWPPDGRGMQRVGGVEGSLLETLVLPVQGEGEGMGLRLVALGGHSVLEPKRRELLCFGRAGVWLVVVGGLSV